MTGKIFVISFFLAVLFTSVVIAECPEKPSDCTKDQVDSLEGNAEISYAENAQPSDVVKYWSSLSPNAQNAALARGKGEGLETFENLGGPSQSKIMLNPQINSICNDCVSSFATSDLVNPSTYPLYQQTMRDFLSPEGAISGNPEAAKKILELECNGCTFDGNELLGNSDYNLKFISGPPPELHGKDPKTGKDAKSIDLTEVGEVEYRSIQGGQFDDESLPSDGDEYSDDATPSFPTTWQASIDTFNFNIRGGDGITSNDDGSFTFTNGAEAIDITPREPLQPNELIVSFDPASQVFIQQNTSVDIQIDENVFSTRKDNQNWQETIFDPRLDASLPCSLRNAFAEFYDQITNPCDKTVFTETDFEKLQEVAVEKGIPQTGREYLQNIVRTVQQDIPITLQDEKSALKDNFQAVTFLDHLEKVSQRNQYATISLTEQGYDVKNQLTIQNPGYIIIIHSGNVSKTENLIEAEHATIFWNLNAYPDELTYNSIEAKNVVTGRWNATIFQDNVTKVQLLPSVQGYAQIRNFDADVHLKTEGTLEVNYLPEGRIFDIQSKGPRISEIEYGDTLEFYQRGSVWRLFFSLESFEANDFKDDFFQLRNGQSVLNTTMYSDDSHVLFKPASYKVGTFENESAKTICYVDCSVIEDQIVVANDDTDLISVGNLGNMSVTYGVNFLNVFDSHTIHIERLLDGLSGTFRTMLPKSSQNEDDLLERLNLEANMPLNRRESLEEHQQLLYQQVQPSSYASFGTDIRFVHGPKTKLEFYSYRIDDQRKIVINEFQYNTVLDLTLQSLVVPEIETTGILDDNVYYSIEDDLTMEPQVYGNVIRFENPETTRKKFGAFS